MTICQWNFRDSRSPGWRPRRLQAAGADGGLAPHSVLFMSTPYGKCYFCVDQSWQGTDARSACREGCDETTCLGHDLVCTAPRFGEVPNSVAVSLAGPPTQPWRALQLIDGVA